MYVGVDISLEDFPSDVLPVGCNRRFGKLRSSTVVDNQSPPIISAIIDLLFLLLELMRTSHARFVAKFQ